MTVALVVIARDEARCIARCLASVRPFVDRMVVVDTGSADATPALAHAAGAAVHHYAWIDDFAAARNRALELADADWNVILDADEWLAHGGAAVAALRGAAPSFAAQVRVDSEFDADDGVALAPSWLTRVLPRGARFEGRIHEQVMGSLPRRRLPVRVGHDGYRTAQQAGKAGRNERLLRLALADAPGDAYLRYQLGKDLQQREHHAEALPHYEAAYATEPADGAGWRHDLVLRFMHALKKTAAFERAVGVAEAEMAHWPTSPDYYFALGDLLLDWAVAEPARAAELLPMIEASWQTCLALGENLDLEGAVAGRGSYLAAKNLAAFHQSLGHDAEALHFRSLEAELRRQPLSAKEPA